MFEKLKGVVARFEELNGLLGDASILADQTRYQKLAKEHADMRDLVAEYLRYEDNIKELADNQELVETEEGEMLEMAQDEISRLKKEIEGQEEKLTLLLLPKDPFDEKNIYLEIRAGAGGDEAALFGADLFRAYTRFAETRNWRVELISKNETGSGGLKEVIAMITGNSVYSELKFEKGVHRVQRIPTTESSGRIHTSTVTVAVMPEADDVELDIEAKDLRIDVYRASGPGGQSVNTTDSAVRITHVPSGLVVQCQDEKSQHKNKAQALKILKARLLEKMQEEQQQKISQDRRSQVGTGDRSERIRTYNYPQGRVSDHRINLTLHKLTLVMEGDFNELIEALRTEHQADLLKGQQESLASGESDTV